MDPITLRYYQHNAVEWVLQRAAQKHNARLLIVLPSGGGKTIIAATILSLTVGRHEQAHATFVAHREELFEQMDTACRLVGIPPTVIGSRIYLARPKNIQMNRDVAVADVVITDESHRDAGPYRRAFRQLYENTLRIGFTATPERLDGKALREDYDEMLVAAQPSELIAGGHIVAPTIFTVPPTMLPDLRRVRVSNGEFVGGDIEQFMSTKAIMGNVVEHWCARAENRQTLVFACSVVHARKLVVEFARNGVDAGYVAGAFTKRERRDMIDSFKAREFPVLISCDLLSEGLDIPDVKCVVMARPTASLVVSNQQAGRCARPSRNDDRTPLILDHVGNVLRHGYPHADREWSLDGIKERKEPLVITACPKCHAVVPRNKTCKECSTDLKPQNTTSLLTDDIDVKELPGELIEYAAAIPEAIRLAEFKKLREFAVRRGFSIEWATDVFKAKYGSAS